MAGDRLTACEQELLYAFARLVSISFKNFLLMSNYCQKVGYNTTCPSRGDCWGKECFWHVINSWITVRYSFAFILLSTLRHVTARCVALTSLWHHHDAVYQGWKIGLKKP